jgi:hypothetical protein
LSPHHSVDLGFKSPQAEKFGVADRLSDDAMSSSPLLRDGAAGSSEDIRKGFLPNHHQPDNEDLSNGADSQHYGGDNDNLLFNSSNEARRKAPRKQVRFLFFI